MYVFIDVQYIQDLPSTSFLQCLLPVDQPQGLNNRTEGSVYL